MSSVLSVDTVATAEGIRIADVRCRHRRGPGVAEESGAHAIVFVRRGCFARGDTLLDPTLAYCMQPGEEHRFDHPHAGGDDCTALFLDEDGVAALPGGALPTAPLRVTPALDLAHRLLLATARRGEDVGERAVLLAAAALEQARPPRARDAHRALADGAREALAEAPERSLRDLAALLAVSPHHLSGVFGAETGETIARHRMRLRARAALERLGDGEHDLARLAADLGFADQSHLCRVMHAETGSAPSALRARLS